MDVDVMFTIFATAMALVFIYPICVITKTLHENYKLVKDKLKKVERRAKRTKLQELYLCHKLRAELENRYQRSIIAATLRTTIEEVKANELRQAHSTLGRDTVLQEAQELSKLDPLMNRFTPSFQPLQNQFNLGLKESVVFGDQGHFGFGESNVVKRGTSVTQTKVCKAVGAISKKDFANVRKRKHLHQKFNKPIIKQMIKSACIESKRPTETKKIGTFVYNAQLPYFNSKRHLKIPTLKIDKINEPDQRSLTYSVRSFPAISSTTKHKFQNCERSFSDINLENMKDNNQKLSIKKRYQHSCSNQPIFMSKMSPAPYLKKDINKFLNVKMNLIQSNETFDQSLGKVRSETNCGIQVDFVRSGCDIKETVSDKLIVKSRNNKTIMIQNIFEERLKSVNFKRCRICMSSNLIGFGKLKTRAFKILIKLKKSIILLKFNLYFICKRRKGCYPNVSSKFKQKTNVSDKKASKLVAQGNHIDEKYHKKRHNLLTHNASQNRNTCVIGEQLGEGDFDKINEVQMAKLKSLFFNQNKDENQDTLEFYTEEEINKAILKQCIGLSREGFMDASTFCEHIPEIIYCLKNERKLSTILEEPAEESIELYHKGNSTESTEVPIRNKYVDRKSFPEENYISNQDIITCKTSGVFSNNESVMTIFDENEDFEMISSSEEQMIGSEQSVTSDQELFTNDTHVKDFTVRLTSSKGNMLLYLEDKKLLTLGKFSGNKTCEVSEYRPTDEISNVQQSSERRTLLSHSNSLDLKALFQNDKSITKPEEKCLTAARSQSESQNVYFLQSTEENWRGFSHHNTDFINSLKLLFDIKKFSEQYIEFPISSLLLGIETQDIRNGGLSSSVDQEALTCKNFVIEYPSFQKEDATDCCDDSNEENEQIFKKTQSGDSLFMSTTLIINHNKRNNEGYCSRETPAIVVEGTVISTTQDEVEVFEQGFPTFGQNLERLQENMTFELENCKQSEEE